MNRIISTDGTVTITIYNDKDIYYSQNVHFQKGHILDNIVNKLPLGEYRCVIEYSGNKYFQPSTLDMIFLVEKRLAKCTVDSDYYYGDLQERIIINGVPSPLYRFTISVICFTAAPCKCAIEALLLYYFVIFSDIILRNIESIGNIKLHIERNR